MGDAGDFRGEADLLFRLCAGMVRHEGDKAFQAAIVRNGDEILVLVHEDHGLLLFSKKLDDIAERAGAFAIPDHEAIVAVARHLQVFGGKIGARARLRLRDDPVDRPGTIYLDLERLADQRKLEDAGAFLQAQVGRLTIIDEVHRVPQLFAELRGIIDERRTAGQRTGQFLLLGSASLDLVQHASETLAGRVAYVEMGPITVEEATRAGIEQDALWLRGGFPDSLTARSDSQSFTWRQNFIRSYLERDVPMFAPRMPAATIGRLWTMLANAQGSMLNQARLAQGLGVSAPMIGR